MVHRAAHCGVRTLHYCVMLAVSTPILVKVGGNSSQSWSLNFYLSLPSETPDKVCRGTPEPWGPSSASWQPHPLIERMCL